MPSDRRTIAGLRQLLSEARELCRHAEERLLGEPEKIAIQHLYGQVTADARIAFDFRGSLARRPSNGSGAPSRRSDCEDELDIVNPASADLSITDTCDVASRDLRRLLEPPHMGGLSLGG
jgi:hypothetical protein